MRISCATLLWLSGRKTASACQREVSLVLSISSGVDKKTDGTGEVRGPCYGWQVCLFGLSLISCFPPSMAHNDSAYSLTWKWPCRDGSRPLFTRESTLPAPLTTQTNSKHMGQVWAYCPFSDKNNNWLICTHIAEPSLGTVGRILTKTNIANTNSKYTYQIKVMETEWEEKCWHVRV